MTRLRFRRIRALGPILDRAFWALMLLMHAPALVGGWRSLVTSSHGSEGLGTCVALSVAMLFFVLKLRGTACLEFRPGKHTWVTIFLVITLIHVDCIRPELDGTLVSNCAVVLATTTLVGGLTQMPRAFREVLAHASFMPRPNSSTGQAAATLWLDLSRPRCWVLCNRLFLLRAPPA